MNYPNDGQHGFDLAAALDRIEQANSQSIIAEIRSEVIAQVHAGLLTTEQLKELNDAVTKRFRQPLSGHTAQPESFNEKSFLVELSRRTAKMREELDGQLGPDYDDISDSPNDQING